MMRGTRMVVAALFAVVGTSAAAVPAPGAAAPAAVPAAAVPAASVRSASAGLGSLPWASGAYLPGDDPGAHDAFAAWRGAATTVAVTWPPRQRWSDVTDPAWVLDRWRDDPRTLVLGVPPFPEAEGASLAACAAGAYDDRWRAFGDAMAASGRADRTIVRLGWEFNGDWYAWAARDPGAFAACWRHAQAAAESRAPALRWDWTVNRGPSQLGIDPRAAYPGDAWVDVVGVDSYDGWPGVTSEDAWQQHYAGPYGLRFWADFARQHGKRLSVPEWGVYPGTAWAGHNGGDNPLYVARMFGFFAEQRDNLAYEAYFDEPAPYYGGALSLNPLAAAEYLRQVAGALALPPSGPPPPAVPPAPDPTAQPPVPQPPVPQPTQPTVQPPAQPTAQPTTGPTEPPGGPVDPPSATGVPTPTTAPTGAPTEAPTPPVGDLPEPPGEGPTTAPSAPDAEPAPDPDATPPPWPRLRPWPRPGPPPHLPGWVCQVLPEWLGDWWC